MSQKIDGQRMVLSIDSGKVTGYNRNGVERDVPATISNYLKNMPVSFTLDGELLDDQYHVFDIISGTICSWQLERRYQLVCDLAERMDSSIIRKVSIHTLNKREIFDDLLYSNAEGVVFKKLSAPYRSGRNNNFIKYKFLV
jgi:bifunctional non-homologous end joining protein LigD